MNVNNDGEDKGGRERIYSSLSMRSYIHSMNVTVNSSKVAQFINRQSDKPMRVEKSGELDST